MSADRENAAPVSAPEGVAPEDAELLSAVAAGDRQAFGALYHRHAPILLGLLV